MERLGVLGGTFNPPHLGHVALARRAREQLGLDRVALMPARIAPHKLAAADPGPGHRLRMCALAVKDAGGLSACALEIERQGPSYTVETLRAMHAGHPDASLTFITGADTAGTLPSWREPTELLELADLAVASRSGVERKEVLAALAPLIGAGGDPDDGAGGGAPGPCAEGRSLSVKFLEMDPIDISSSMARRRAARGEPIEDLVGPAVARYIVKHGLYRRSIAGES